MRRISEAKVIAWEQGVFGVWYVYDDGRSSVHRIGPRDRAERVLLAPGTIVAHREDEAFLPMPAD